MSEAASSSVKSILWLGTWPELSALSIDNKRADVFSIIAALALAVADIFQHFSDGAGGADRNGRSLFIWVEFQLIFVSENTSSR